MGSAFLPDVGRRPLRDPALPWDRRVDDPLHTGRPATARCRGLGREAHTQSPMAPVRPTAPVRPPSTVCTAINPYAGRDRTVTVWPFADHDGGCGHGAGFACGSNPPTPLAWPHRRGLSPEL